MNWPGLPPPIERARSRTSSRELPALKRVRFFFGKLLAVDDLAAEQEYALEKARRHNRHLHGFGIVDGLGVRLQPGTGGCSISVEPGYAIDRFGNEIELAEAACLPLTSASGRIVVGLKYAEREVDNVPAGTGLEASGVEETAEVVLLDASPGAGPGLALDEVVPLSIVKRTKKGWRTVRRFKPPKARMA